MNFASQAHLVLDSGNYGNDFLANPNSVLEAKDWWKDAGTRLALEANLSANGMYGVVFGHMPDAFNVTNDVAQMDGKKLIKIDSGMAPEAGANPGHFLVFTTPSQLNNAAPPDALSMTRQGVSHPL